MNLDNLLTLANNALEVKNSVEADNYAKRVLEEEPQNYQAWFIRVKAAGIDFTPANQRIDEAITYLSYVIKYCPEGKKKEIITQCENEFVNNLFFHATFLLGRDDIKDEKNYFWVFYNSLIDNLDKYENEVHPLTNRQLVCYGIAKIIYEVINKRMENSKSVHGKVNEQYETSKIIDEFGSYSDIVRASRKLLKLDDEHLEDVKLAILINQNMIENHEYCMSLNSISYTTYHTVVDYGWYAHGSTHTESSSHTYLSNTAKNNRKAVIKDLKNEISELISLYGEIVYWNKHKKETELVENCKGKLKSFLEDGKDLLVQEKPEITRLIQNIERLQNHDFYNAPEFDSNEEELITTIDDKVKEIERNFEKKKDDKLAKVVAILENPATNINDINNAITFLNENIDYKNASELIEKCKEKKLAVIKERINSKKCSTEELKQFNKELEVYEYNDEIEIIISQINSYLKTNKKKAIIVGIVATILISAVTLFLILSHHCERDGHVYSDWIIDIEATCESSGLKHRECEYCKDYYEVTIKALGHKVKNGVCTVCGEKPCANGHTYVNYECTVCHDKIDTTGWSRGLKIENGVVYGKGTCSDTNIVIPSYAPDGTKVTSIGESVFQGCKNLTSITIPNSVTSIGYEAFQGCTSLKSITIPSSVTSVGSYAFWNCGSLTSITIPSSVTTIGECAFGGCKSLTSITIPNSVTSIGNLYFSSCSSLTSITIPNSVTISNGELCLWNCTSLKSITIPNSVTSITDFGFQDCSSLTSITIPNSVTSIGKSAFDGCTSLKSITIPNSITNIGKYAFEGVKCNIKYQGTKKQWEAIRKNTYWYIGFDKKIVCTDGTITP